MLPPQSPSSSPHRRPPGTAAPETPLDSLNASQAAPDQQPQSYQPPAQQRPAPAPAFVPSPQSAAPSAPPPLHSQPPARAFTPPDMAVTMPQPHPSSPSPGRLTPVRGPGALGSVGSGVQPPPLMRTLENPAAATVPGASAAMKLLAGPPPGQQPSTQRLGPAPLPQPGQPQSPPPVSAPAFTRRLTEADFARLPTSTAREQLKIARQQVEEQLRTTINDVPPALRAANSAWHQWGLQHMSATPQRLEEYRQQALELERQIGPELERLDVNKAPFLRRQQLNRIEEALERREREDQVREFGRSFDPRTQDLANDLQRMDADFIKQEENLRVGQPSALPAARKSYLEAREALVNAGISRANLPSASNYAPITGHMTSPAYVNGTWEDRKRLLNEWGTGYVSQNPHARQQIAEELPKLIAEEEIRDLQKRHGISQDEFTRFFNLYSTPEKHGLLDNSAQARIVDQKRAQRDADIAAMDPETRKRYDAFTRTMGSVTKEMQRSEQSRNRMAIGEYDFGNGVVFPYAIETYHDRKIMTIHYPSGGTQRIELGRDEEPMDHDAFREYALKHRPQSLHKRGVGDGPELERAWDKVVDALKYGGNRIANKAGNAAQYSGMVSANPAGIDKRSWETFANLVPLFADYEQGGDGNMRWVMRDKAEYLHGLEDPAHRRAALSIMGFLNGDRNVDLATALSAARRAESAISPDMLKQIRREAGRSSDGASPWTSKARDEAGRLFQLRLLDAQDEIVNAARVADVDASNALNLQQDRLAVTGDTALARLRDWLGDRYLNVEYLGNTAGDALPGLVKQVAPFGKLLDAASEANTEKKDITRANLKAGVDPATSQRLGQAWGATTFGTKLAPVHATGWAKQFLPTKKYPWLNWVTPVLEKPLQNQMETRSEKFLRQFFLPSQQPQDPQDPNLPPPGPEMNNGAPLPNSPDLPNTPPPQPPNGPNGLPMQPAPPPLTRAWPSPQFSPSAAPSISGAASPRAGLPSGRDMGNGYQTAPPQIDPSTARHEATRAAADARLSPAARLAQARDLFRVSDLPTRQALIDAARRFDPRQGLSFLTTARLAAASQQSFT